MIDSYHSMNTSEGSNPKSLLSRFLCIWSVLSILLLAVLLVIVLALIGSRHQSEGRNPLCASTCGRVCMGSTLAACYDKCYHGCTNPPKKPTSLLGGYLKRNAVQHIGLTVHDMKKALTFYTEILGGALVPKAGGHDFVGDGIFNTLFQNEELLAHERGEAFAQMRIADLRSGKDHLDAYYIHFGTVNIELLQYRPADAPSDSNHSLPYAHHSGSPSQINNQHIAFFLEDHVDANQFVDTMETECAKRGLNVRCNRIKRVESEAERVQVGHQKKYNSFTVKGNEFEGWTLAYCKGPDGEQLEFNKAIAKAQVDFDTALAHYLQSK
eukprot:gnl/Trimastix_PCT/5082.p1 GENE.gnl/Trimastix_PCT/5082~~gnl/Trimastix_PCT/5082.p1  ORF type:complete len:325 (-),score=75.25 gnl/Trimastix_PCT/5082:145-1119(-)